MCPQDKTSGSSEKSEAPLRCQLGDSTIPRIYFSKWNKESRTAYLRAARKNMEELQMDYDRRNTRLNTLMIVNGTVLGLILAFMVNADIINNPDLKWTGVVMVVGFIFLLISFVTAIWTSSGTKDAPVMDFWVGTNPDAWDIIDDPDLLTEDLMNGFLMRCVDLKDTLERNVEKIKRVSRIFAVGLVILMMSVIMVLIFS